MKKLALISCLLVAFVAQAQKEKGEAYIKAYKEIAIEEMLRTGVPASITLAQGILESQYGESDLVKGSNNHFGIKCKTEWTGPKIFHDDDEKGECFRVYATPEESYKDHSDFLKTRPNYAFLFKLDPTDYDGWAKGLKKAGYATNPAYPQKLLKVISDFNLQQYSLEALARQNNPVIVPAITTEAVVSTVALKEELPKQTETIVNPPIEKPVEELQVKEQPVKEQTAKEQAPKEEKEPEVVNTVTDTPAVVKNKKQSNYPSGIFSINRTKVIYVAEGTSLLSLATQYDISFGKLIEFNELAAMEVLDADRLVFIERKQKKGTADVHLVAMGETMHDICQLEGIRLESLVEYNHLSKSAPLRTGDKIYLHPIVAPATSSKSPK
ncbi:MAG: Flagellum-specific peptidoglycan hydrolase FlgJ [Sediminibacterium sp.]|nr:Flagellum-specific peptidoglycan hydrolase FlgJ [Sediminibacterium sp.]